MGCTNVKLGRSAWAGLVTALIVCGSASAQNLPPRAEASADSPLVAPGQSVQFIGSTSRDPDDGPDPLSFEWDFGDGSPLSTLADPTHVYSERGRLVVSLRVFDGAANAFASLAINVLEVPAPGRPRASSPLALTADGAWLWVVNSDAGSVSLVDTSGPTLVEELPCCEHPVAVTLSEDETRLAVACRDSGEVALIDTATVSVTDLQPVGRSAHAAVLIPGSTAFLVTLPGEGAVRLVEWGDLSQQRTIDTGGRPRAAAVSHDGTRAVVTDFLASQDQGRVFVLDLTTEAVEMAVPLAIDRSTDTSASGRGVPNVLMAAVIEPSGRLAHVGGLKSNIGRGSFRDGFPLAPTNRVRGLVASVELADGTDQIDWRVDTNDADTASALAFSADGALLYATHQGTGQLSVYDLLLAHSVDTSDGSAVPFIKRVEVGFAPNGLLVQGDRAYVANMLSRSVSILDLSDPRSPVVLEEVVTAGETLVPRMLNGKRLFFSSERPRLSSEGYVACWSCHPAGAHDGVTWDFSSGGEGLRNTIDLRGRAGTGHGPVHWSANFDEIQDFENDIVFGFGGTGLAEDGQPPNPPLATPNGGRGDDLDDLALFVSGFDSVPSSPFRNPDGSLSNAAERGRDVFYSVETRCRACHVAPRFTDSTLTGDPATFRLHDVGTFAAGSGSRLGGELLGLDTPTLLLLWDGAPYLHDGRAADLQEVLTDWNPQDRHGVTSHLAGSEIDDLVEFLLSIDGDADVLPPPASVVPDETSPPGSVRPLFVTRSGPRVSFEWDLSDRADTYVVTRGDLGVFAVHAADDGVGSCDTQGELVLHDDDDVGDGSSYFYLVAARNAAGEGSPGLGRAQRTPTARCP